MNANSPDQVHSPAEFTDGFAERLRAIIEQREHELRRFLDTQPQQLECKRHPGRFRALSFKLSWEETAKHGGMLKAVYEPCFLCEEQARIKAENQRLASFGVPPLLLTCSFETWDNPADPNMAAVRDFATQTRRGFMLIVGPPGTGKTHLAVSAMRHFKNAWFVRHYQFMRMLRATYDSKHAADPIEWACDADLLVFDDLGVSTRGNDENPAVHQVLEHRFEFGKPTIITSNLNNQQIAEWLGPRLTDRIRQSIASTIRLTGNSKRPTLRNSYITPQND